MRNQWLSRIVVIRGAPFEVRGGAEPRGPRSPDRIPPSDRGPLIAEHPDAAESRAGKRQRPGYPQKKIPALRVAEAKDEGGLWPGEYAERRSASGCGKSSPAEVDHALEIAREGEPKPASLFKLAND